MSCQTNAEKRIADLQKDVGPDQAPTPRHFPASAALTAALRAPVIMQGPMVFDEAPDESPRLPRVSFDDLDLPQVA